MAIDVYSNRDKRYGMAEQGVWNTAMIDSVNVIELDCEHFTLPIDPTIRESPQVHASRLGRQGDVQVDTYLTMPEFSLTMDLKMQSVDHLIHSYFQKVVEGASTPFSKTFTLLATQPDFTVIASGASEGHLMTIWERDPVSAHSMKVKNCIAKSLTISIAANGRTKVVAGMVGMGYPVTSTPSGVWTRTPYQYLHAANRALFTMNFGGGAVNLTMKSCEIALTQEVVGVGQDGAGNYATFGIVSRAGTFKMQVLKDANYLAARTALAAGTEVANRVGFGNATPGTVDGDFDMAFNGKLTKAPYDNEDLLGVTIEGRLLGRDDGTGTPIITMANAVDRGW